jgi:3-oxoacyl-[acyl-carrier-protein] synthase II
VDRFDVSELRSKKAALVSGFNPRDFIAPMKMRRMNTLSRLGVSAMRLAVDDSPRKGLASSGSSVGVAIGTTFGPVQTSVEYLNEYVLKGPALAPPQLFAESVANAPGSHIAIEWGLRGFNLTFTQRESSTMAALLFASAQIEKGTVEEAIVGGVEEMNDITFSVLDRIGALAHPEPGVEEECRPLDRDRNGLSVGEGGAVFVLESVDSSRDDLYGIVSGFGIAKDPTASISNWGTGAGSVARAMNRAIADAGLERSQIDAIWASANSSVNGDRLEYRAVQELFGEAAPPVVATKGLFGEYAAAGALHLATAFIALREQWLPATVGFRSGEDAMRLEVVTERRQAALNHILVNSLSAGGGVISVVLSRAI